MSTEVNLATPSGKIFAAGAILAAAGGLIVLAVFVTIGLIAAGVIS